MSPVIPLALGITAGVLFLAVFIGALVVTMRNRRIIIKYSERSKDSRQS